MNMTKNLDRTGYIGGSDVPAIFNIDYGCQRRCWYEKRGVEPDYPLQENYHMLRGKEFEGNALRKYKKQTGRKLLNKMPPLLLEMYPFIGGHVDAVTKADTAPVEVKCPSVRNFAKIKREGIPEGYVLQLHHYMGLLNADYGSYAIFSTETTELFIIDVPRNNKLIYTILQAEMEFWEKVQKAIEPERLLLTDKRCQSCNWRVICQGIFQEHEQSFWDKELATPRPDLESLVQDYARARTIFNEAEEYFEETKNNLKANLGDTQIADVMGIKVYYQQFEQSRWDLKRLETEHPELVKDYKQKSISRSLRVYL